MITYMTMVLLLNVIAWALATHGAAEESDKFSVLLAASLCFFSASAVVAGVLAR